MYNVCVATHRHHSEYCVDDPNPYGGIDRLTDTSLSEDSRRVIKDLEAGGKKQTRIYIFRNCKSQIWEQEQKKKALRRSQTFSPCRPVSTSNKTHAVCSDSDFFSPCNPVTERNHQETERGHSLRWCRTTAERGASWGQQTAAVCRQRRRPSREHRAAEYCHCSRVAKARLFHFL